MSSPRSHNYSPSWVACIMEEPPYFVPSKTSRQRQDLDLAETGRNVDNAEISTISGSNVSQNGEIALSVVIEPELPGYLHSYLDWMYFIWICPFKYTDNGAETPTPLRIIRKISFWLFIAILILDCFEEVKFYAILFCHKKNLYYYWTVLFLAINGLGNAYFAKLLASNSQGIIKMLNDISSCSITRHIMLTSRKAMILIVASCFLSLIWCLFWEVSFNNWSLKQTFLKRSCNMAFTIFTWDYEFGNKTKEEYLNESLNHYTPATIIILGILENIVKFCGSLQWHVFDDFLLMGVLTLHELTKDLKTRIDTTLPATVEQSELTLLWKEYKRLKHISMSLNGCIGELIVLMHLKRIDLFGFTLLRLYHMREKSILWVLIAIFKILKSVYAYYIALNLSKTVMNTNLSLRTWIHERCHSTHVETVDVDGVPVNVAVLLDELKMKPIGIGNGAFHIDTELILKLAACIASYFVFLAKESKDLLD